MLKQFPDEKRTLDVSHRIFGEVNLIYCKINQVGATRVLYAPKYQFALEP